MGRSGETPTSKSLRSAIVNFGPQPVKHQALHELFKLRGSTIQQIALSRFHHKEIKQDFALRREQGRIARLALGQPQNIRRHQVMQEILGFQPLRG